MYHEIGDLKSASPHYNKARRLYEHHHGNYVLSLVNTGRHREAIKELMYHQKRRSRYHHENIKKYLKPLGKSKIIVLKDIPSDSTTIDLLDFQEWTTVLAFSDAERIWT